MQKLPLPINAIPYQNVDDILVNQLGSELKNGYIDELGFTNKRPGFEERSKLGTSIAVDGVYWWENREILISVSQGRVYKTINASGTFVDITGDTLLTGTRPTFADNGDILVIANGGRMVTTDGTTLTQYIADPDAPTAVTHVAFLDQFLIVNEVGTGRFRFADFITAPTVWNAVDVFTAEADPDNIIALYVNKRIIHLFGTKSTEFWFNDGISPFSRLQGTTLQRGAMSPYSTVNVNETFYFFDNRRRLNQLIGQQAQILGTSFDITIQNLDSVAETIADYVTVDGKNWVIFTFPESNRTLMFDITGNYWSEWTNHNQFTATDNRFIGNCYAYAKTFNQHIFGSFKSDQLLEMKSSFFDDAGDRITFSKITGWVDHDFPDNKKTSYKITFRLKTGVGLDPSGSVEPFCRLRWRDDGDTNWKNFRSIGLKVRGEREFRVTSRYFGSYYSRQWEIQMYEKVPFVIGSAVEGVDVAEF